MTEVLKLRGKVGWWSAYRSLSRREPLGRWGEWVALGHLLTRRWDVLARNWTSGRGELDLVAFDNGTLVIIEVKTRRHNPSLPLPEEQVGRKKEAQLEGLAFRFASRYELEDCPIRFDLIAIETENGREYELRHYLGFM